jgi:hypothetical protein
MTREEFTRILENEKCSYEIKGNKIVVKGNGSVFLSALTSLPPDVEFRNEGDVWIHHITSLPPGIVFNNQGSVYLGSLNSISPGVVFNNERDISLYYMIGGHFKRWKGNIEGVDNKRLMNLMISKGLFER